MGLGEFGEGGEEVFREVPDYGDGDGVAHGAVGFVVVGGELVGIGCPHEAGGLSGGDEAGAQVPIFVEDEELAAASPFGGAEAAGNVVEAEFEDLPAVAGAAVAGEDSAMAARDAFEAGAVIGWDDGEQSPGLGLIEDRGFPVDDLGKGFGALFWKGHGPEDASLQGGDGLGDGPWVQPAWPEFLEIRRINILMDGDNEHPGAGLREPVAGIDPHRPDFVGAGAEGLVEEAVVLSSVRGQQAGDVLKGDDFGRLRHFIEDPQPFPEKSAAGGSQTAHFSGER